MKVNGIPVVKLIKPGDCLGGALLRCTNYVAKHNNIPFDVVLLAGMNDLSKREVKPEDLIENLDKSLTELKHFQNVNEIFLCKIPHDVITCQLIRKSSFITSYCLNVFCHRRIYNRN